MKALLILLSATGALAAEAPMEPEDAKQRWETVTHICWEGETLEGESVSETEMKVACITAGVLTQILLEADYCIDPNRGEWLPCK